MSLDKSIQHHKDHRRQYNDSRRWSKNCRNHGVCGYCRSNRIHSQHKKYLSAYDKLKNYHADQQLITFDDPLIDKWDKFDDQIKNILTSSLSSAKIPLRLS